MADLGGAGRRAHPVKPLWIKAKSLKGWWLSARAGGLSQDARRSRCAALGQTAVRFQPRLDCAWRRQGGCGLRHRAGAHKVFGLTDAGRAADHFLVETDGFLILVDSKRGAAYVGS